MRKVKVLLTAMIVLGTVGGVLAFKAKRSVKYCTAATVNGACPSTVKCEAGTVQRIHDSGALKCYVETQVTANCATDKPACNSTPAKITAEI